MVMLFKEIKPFQILLKAAIKIIAFRDKGRKTVKIICREDQSFRLRWHSVLFCRTVNDKIMMHLTRSLNTDLSCVLTL